MRKRRARFALATSVRSASSANCAVAALCERRLRLPVRLGWAADSDALNTVLVRFGAMKANSAVGFLLARIARAIFPGDGANRLQAALDRLCAAFDAVAGLRTLVEYLFGVSF